ncbi:hypothetical protein C8J56DRAFT_897856 [Mycena floridula]|nr:hypothetical protein C8J56DRAFT_897856 [Mycena floridula]
MDIESSNPRGSQNTDGIRFTVFMCQSSQFLADCMNYIAELGQNLKFSSFLACGPVSAAALTGLKHYGARKMSVQPALLHITNTGRKYNIWSVEISKAVSHLILPLDIHLGIQHKAIHAPDLLICMTKATHPGSLPSVERFVGGGPLEH